LHPLCLQAAAQGQLLLHSAAAPAPAARLLHGRARAASSSAARRSHALVDSSLVCSVYAGLEQERKTGLRSRTEWPKLDGRRVRCLQLARRGWLYRCALVRGGVEDGAWNLQDWYS
jgi:hypothetical protein